VWLDGNALAGLLREIFDAEMTMAERACRTCGKRNPLGAHRAYRGAGHVLRCPACGDLAMRITVLPDRHIVHMTGMWTLDVPRT
jgi:DNA-directed RNA polymerase subunit RPC12/RpoP